MPKKCYLIDPNLVKKSRLHTHYAGPDPDKRVEGQPQVLHKLVFVDGIARNVPEADFQRFKDLGVCDTKRPSRGDDD